MGSCSPIHFRSAAACITLLCVGLSYAGSSGLAYYVGGKSAGIHQILPFLLIGIGADDMFVISSAVDQTNPRDSVEKRMMDAMKAAGTSVTITSATNAIAFFLGTTTSLEALGSFCFFAGLGILYLYFTSLTIFSAFMVWDITRQMKQKGDCCGLCMCKEDTLICCKASCLTDKQKAYPFQGQESDPVPLDAEYSSTTQKFLHQNFSKWITSKPGSAAILVIWSIYLGLSIYGISNVVVDFKTTFFIEDSAFVMQYINRQDQYFASGEDITFYVDNSDIDYTSPAV